MTETSEIKIPKNFTKSMFLLIGSWAFAYAGYFIWENSISFSSQKYSTGFIQSIGLIALLFFGLIGVIRLIDFIQKKPGLIINEHGIINHTTISGGFLIEWKHINNLKRSQIKKTKFILVNVINPDFYLNKVGMFKRFWMSLNNKFYGTPLSIATNSLDISSEELIELIRSSKKRFRV